MKQLCYWYDPAEPGYCCWGIDPAGMDTEELWAAPVDYSRGRCPCAGDSRSRDCLFSDKKPWQKTEPYPWAEQEYTSRFSVWDYELEKNVLKKYEGNDPEPSLPGRIEKIGDFAFADNKIITGVYLPKELTEIGENAFNYCKNLKRVSIPPKVKVIGEFAFHMCQSLTCVEFAPEGALLAEIGKDAFCGCTSLAEAVIPRGPIKLGDSAFWGCAALERVCLGAGAVSIGRDAFAHCPALKSVLIPESVTDIDDEAFSRADGEYEPSPEVSELMDAILMPNNFVGVTVPLSPIPPMLTIVGVPGSTAQEYALRKGIAFRTPE